ncbi:MAG TPA: hypothetical protein VF476_04185 [Chitinophagaceae bacterium]
MSRNFTPDQTLIDQLQLDNTEAFEELHHRYCISLYSYCINKLHSPHDARRIVRDIFVDLWEKRQQLPPDFSISVFLYTEVRRSVVKCVNEKLIENADIVSIEKNIIPGFRLETLQLAKEPVKAKQPAFTASAGIAENRSQEQWWHQYIPHVNIKNVRYAFQRVMHLW